MDFAHLEAFVEVANQRSFSRAAEALYLTQPSVTARIQALEREVGERLLDRSRRNVRLTEVGTVFLPHAKRLLHSWHACQEELSSVRRVEVGTLVLASGGLFTNYVLPSVLSDFRAQFTGIEVHIRTGRPEEVLKMLLGDEAHIGLVRVVHHKDIETQVLFDEEILLVCAGDYELANFESVSVEQLSCYPFILYGHNSSNHALMQSLFRKQGILPLPPIEVDSIEGQKKMAEASLGIAVLPRLAVQPELDSGALHVVPVHGFNVPARRIALITPRRVPLNPVERAFVALLQAKYALTQPAAAPTR